MKYNATKTNKAIKKALLERIKELNISQSDIVKDATKFGYKGINKVNLSIYLSNKSLSQSTLSEQHIFWLCYRYCIDIKVHVIKMDYNERKALAYLKHFSNAY